MANEGQRPRAIRNRGDLVSQSLEIRRARELLASSAELLERSRNRPRYASSWLDDRPQERAVTVPVRKVREDAAVSRTMNHGTQKRWNDWAENIARNVAHERDLKLVDIIGGALKDALAERDERIAQLEQRINQLEQQAAGKVTALRTGTSG